MHAIAPAKYVIAGKYELLSQIGQGGMGVVYEAVNRITGRRVALKLLETGGAGESLLREARATGQLESRHIAQVLDAGVDSGHAFLALELLRGADLGFVLANRGRLSIDVALRIALQACAGLAKAHGAGIVHRDIKPANLFVARDDHDEVTVKVLDFGLAKALTPSALGELGRRSLTTEHLLVGTPLYMSPEQARSARTIDGRSDLWSLGVVLYEALTGITPHEHEASVGDIILSICTKRTRIGDRMPELPLPVRTLVDRALEPDVQRRFQSAEEMAHALRALVSTPTLDAELIDVSSCRPSGFVTRESRRSESDAVTRDALTTPNAPCLRTLDLPDSRVVVEASLREGYVLACVHGRMSSGRDAVAANRFLAKTLEEVGLRTLLLDVRLATGTKEGHAALWVWMHEHHDFDRLALLVESASLKRGFNGLAAETRVNARAFDDASDAEAWLLADPSQK